MRAKQQILKFIELNIFTKTILDNRSSKDGQY